MVYDDHSGLKLSRLVFPTSGHFHCQISSDVVLSYDHDLIIRRSEALGDSAGKHSLISIGQLD